MARQTRAQRRARREQQQTSPPNGADRGRSRKAPLPPAPEPPQAQVAHREVPGSGFRRFVGESIAELKKVEWPGQNQVVQGVIVVLVACVIVGVFLYASDQVWKRLVENVFLK